ncbi:MAG: iron-containing alcohol dehydrogenase, partial [Clostridia bacterium]|nr:iron-containing alcohol dehydrogenase [Clostridia bacterium]
MKTLHVNIPKRDYDIHIEEGILDRAGSMISEIFRGEKIAVVTDSNVEPLYGKRLEDSLTAQGYTVKTIVIPAGESSKCQAQLFRLYDEMLEFGLTRADLVIALGGGVVGDLTGYAAAS